MKDYFRVGDFFKYFFRLPAGRKANNRTIRAMHLMNLVAIVIGLTGLIIVIYKNLA